MVLYWPSSFCMRIYAPSPQKNNQANTLHYYTTQAVRGPITKINQSNAILPVQYSVSIGPGIVPIDPAHCVFTVFALFSRVINLLLTKLARDWENIGPRSFLYGPRCSWSVLSRSGADIFPVRPSCLVNKIYILTY